MPPFVDRNRDYLNMTNSLGFRNGFLRTHYKKLMEIGWRETVVNIKLNRKEWQEPSYGTESIILNRASAKGTYIFGGFQKVN